MVSIVSIDLIVLFNISIGLNSLLQEVKSSRVSRRIMMDLDFIGLQVAGCWLLV